MNELEENTKNAINTNWLNSKSTKVCLTSSKGSGFDLFIPPAKVLSVSSPSNAKYLSVIVREDEQNITNDIELLVHITGEQQ